MSTPVFELRNVSFAYLGKFPALSRIDLDILPGQKIAVIGANGSGKSTLLHLLDGLIFPDQGSVCYQGVELKESLFSNDDFSVGFRGKVGLVFQNPDVQLFCPTVRDDIVFGPLQLGLDQDEIKRRLEELAGLLDVRHLLDRSPHQLSIGEKRKAAIASTLIMRPQVLLLDEPTAGLDPQTTRHIIDLVLAANAAGATVVTSTHDLHIVAEIADTVHVFSREKMIVRSGTPDEILQDMPLLEAHNLVHIHPHRHHGVMHAHPHQHGEHHH
jgi:cobalt/nickel transport system ATP-binding protein